jgi:threonine dehydrogenase-like Zn-dependent dehydrogenase
MGYAVDVCDPVTSLWNSVTVIGAIGLLHLLTAKNGGVGKVIVVDLVEERLDYARKLGVSEIINAAKEDVEEGVRQLTEAMAQT